MHQWVNHIRATSIVFAARDVNSDCSWLPFNRLKTEPDTESVLRQMFLEKVRLTEHKAYVCLSIADPI
jgi:hypothetical protein